MFNDKDEWQKLFDKTLELLFEIRVTRWQVFFSVSPQ